MSSNTHHRIAADPENQDTIAQSRGAILQNGRNATAYQIINHGMQRWLHKSMANTTHALVGYVCQGRTGVVAGEPVCKKEDLEKIVDQFQNDLKQVGISRICWFCASADFARNFADRPHYSVILVGAQPVWDPREWGTQIHRYASIRKQLNRARNKGVIVREWTPEQATNHPGLLQCLQEWLEARPFPPLHFLVEPQTLDRLHDRRIFVAEQAGEYVGFLILSPVPRRNGWLVEQIIRGANAPNGTSELMLDTAATLVGKEHYEYLTLGLAPLSKRAGITSGNPRWIRFVLGWIRLHGQRFYNFDGLDYFKSKFVPAYWEPIYAVVNRPRFSLRTLYAIGAAFSNGSPLLALTAGSIKAIRQEMRWLTRRLRSVQD